MKKNLLLSTFVMFLLLLAACGGGGDESADAEDVTTVGEDIEGATELSLWVFAAQHVDFYEDAAESWNEENPDQPISLKVETYPYDQMHNNLLLALQSGSGAPDIVDIEIGRFPNFLEGEPQLLPMNDYVEPVIDEFVESRFEIYSKDGNYYGLPTHVGASVMYYNTEIMDEAGVDIDSIETWEDFKNAGEQVVANTDSVMFNSFPGDHLTFFQLIAQQESDYLDENGAPTMNRQENIDALQLLVDMQEMGIAEVAPGNEPHAEEYYAYMNDGGAAAINMPIWYMGRFIDNMPDLEGKMVVRPMPAFEEGGNRSAGMGGTGTVVTNQTDSPELAQEFLAYAKLSEEGNIKLWTVLGFDPIRHSVWDDPRVLEDNRYFEYFGDDIFDTLNEVRDEIAAVNVRTLTPDVATEMNTSVLNNVLRDGSQTPEEALNAAQETLEPQYQPE
ncbi:ABC transporter substrate-binding protein [Gracilibacillus alcaliphilus]|uniref:ABC transporter substrate-binding protein n=1 Tax=Gracilibacillus alcaliphilus TaxID=1401441 RepID=UPI00195B023C|nr:ABC transporter substrate-binding protein [Gracilibacillus alcaliphilus]MBM7679173.1 arabinosaccharide transport system substrate-binding protein [Gracilibacillus alcaliphilus]